MLRNDNKEPRALDEYKNLLESEGLNNQVQFLAGLELTSLPEVKFDYQITDQQLCVTVSSPGIDFFYNHGTVFGNFHKWVESKPFLTLINSKSIKGGAYRTYYFSCADLDSELDRRQEKKDPNLEYTTNTNPPMSSTNDSPHVMTVPIPEIEDVEGTREQPQPPSIEEMLAVINSVYSNASKDQVVIELQEFTLYPEEGKPEKGWVVHWKSDIPPSFETDFPSHSISTDDYHTICNRMITTKDSMTDIVILKKQLLLRQNFISELESKNNIGKELTDRWNWSNWDNLTPTTAFAALKKRFVIYASQASYSPADIQELRKCLSDFDRLAHAHLVSKDRKVPNNENFINDDTRYRVVSELGEEASRLQSKYGLTSSGEPDAKNPNSKKYSQDIVTIVAKRMTKISELCAKLNPSYDPALVYKGFNAAQPRAITKEQLVNELNTLKSQMISTGHYKNSPRVGAFFFRVTSVSMIDTLIASLPPKKPGILEQIINRFRPT